MALGLPYLSGPETGSIGHGAVEGFALSRDRLPLEPMAQRAGREIDLLKQTSLSAIINAANVVAGRLNFLKGLEELLFDPAHDESFLERDHLHRMLAAKYLDLWRGVQPDG